MWINGCDEWKLHSRQIHNIDARGLPVSEEMKKTVIPRARQKKVDKRNERPKGDEAYLEAKRISVGGHGTTGSDPNEGRSIVGFEKPDQTDLATTSRPSFSGGHDSTSSLPADRNIFEYSEIISIGSDIDRSMDIPEPLPYNPDEFLVFENDGAVGSSEGDAGGLDIPLDDAFNASTDPSKSSTYDDIMYSSLVWQ